MRFSSIYGNHDHDSAYINGMAVRRAKLEDKLCVSAGGTGSDLTSIYLVKWGRMGTHLFYPRGAKNCGVERIDKGSVTVKAADGGQFEAYQNYIECNYGWAVRHSGSWIRIAKVSSSIS